MYYVDETARIDSSQRYSRYIADSDNYRTIRGAQASTDHGTHRVAVTGPLERLGAALIGLGRRLCERHGIIHVEVAFRAVTTASGRDGRHVA